MGKYDDIINLPHPVSKKHRPMPIADRAAQFAPFAALSGYDEAIKDINRLTYDQVELGEDAQSEINEKLRILIDNADQHPELTVTYFEPDKTKAGGQYVLQSGYFKRIRTEDQTIEFTNKKRIALSAILGIESEIFRDMT